MAVLCRLAGTYGVRLVVAFLLLRDRGCPSSESAMDGSATWRSRDTQSSLIGREA